MRVMHDKSTRDFAWLTRALIPRNRSGSHVGIILSFAIFVTFILFLYSIMRPAIVTGEDKKATLTFIESKIEENLSAEFVSITLKILDSENPAETCVRFEDFFLRAMFSTSMFENKGREIVKNDVGNMQPAYYDPVTDIHDLRVDRENQGNTFFKIYYSPVFDLLPTTATPSCTSVYPVSQYNITALDVHRYLFEENVYELMNYYNSNYEGLREEFNIPPGNEFAFGFTHNNGTIIQVGNASKTTGVFAAETPVQYVDVNASLRSGFINVRVW